MAKEKKKTGRPFAEIDKKIFENLCGLQCTKLEFCDWFDVEDDTLESWCKRTYKKGFSEVFARKRGKGKISLRRMQWQNAEKGNTAMLIWLGKQYLNQTDKQEITKDNDSSAARIATAIESLRNED